MSGEALAHDGSRPEDRYVDLVSRMLELPAADRVLSLRTGDGRGIQLVLDSERSLTLRLDGPWTAREAAAAGILMQLEAGSRPDLARLLDPEDPVRGVVFTTENPFSASDLIYRLVTKVLGADPAELTVDKDHEDHDARPAIAAVLDEHRCAELLHEASGVRVRVTLGDSGYSLDVPTALLDPRRGQRHRARQAISDAAWRLNDGDTGSGPGPEGPDDSASSWGYTVYSGGSKEAAEAALRLLCTIVDLPIDVRVSILPIR